MFSGYTLLSDIQKTKRGISDQESSSSAGKNSGVVLVPCCTWKCVPKAISSGVDFSEVPGCHKNYFKDWCPMNSKLNISVLDLLLTLWIMTILSKGCKPDNCESHNSQLYKYLRLLLEFCLSLSQTLLTFLVYVRRSWMTQLILAISLWWLIFL